jgi:hypothetical protein
LTVELEIKDATDTARPPSYLDIHLEDDSEDWLKMKPYDKRDDLNFPTLLFVI